MARAMPMEPLAGANMPRLRYIHASFSMISSPAVVNGIGFTVARGGTGYWDITLNQKVPRILQVFVSTQTATGINEDIVPKWELVTAGSVVRIKSYTAESLTDPGTGTVAHVLIVAQQVLLPRK